MYARLLEIPPDRIPGPHFRMALKSQTRDSRLMVSCAILRLALIIHCGKVCKLKRELSIQRAGPDN
jgi:hypothetical protein